MGKKEMKKRNHESGNQVWEEDACGNGARSSWGRVSEGEVRGLIPVPGLDTELLPCLTVWAPVGTLNSRTL